MTTHQLYWLILGLANLLLGVGIFAFGGYCLLYRMNSVIEKERRKADGRRGQRKAVQPNDDGMVKITAYARIVALILCSLCLMFGGVFLLVTLPLVAKWQIE